MGLTDAETRAKASEEKQKKAVEDLRALFDCEEGRTCGKQLAAGE